MSVSATSASRSSLKDSKAAKAPAHPAMPTVANHPVGLFLLFLVEMWERFSYYGMRAILVLYLVSPAAKGGLGWTEKSASQLYGWYTGLVYLTPIVGGWLADKFIGTRRSLVIGGAIIAAGHFSLAFPSPVGFYLGLALIIIGTGFFKPNVSTMVGQLYEQGDHRRDSGFTIFYMGINLGALIGTIICGYLGESPEWGWHYGFGAAGVGMVAGLLLYMALKDKYLPGIGLTVKEQSPKEAAKAAAHEPLTKDDRDRLSVILIVAFFVIFFWVAFEQAGSSMNLFAANNTDRVIFGEERPASWFQSINPALILLFSPLAAWLWTTLDKKNMEPTTLRKMGLGLLLLAAGFVSMVLGAQGTVGGALVSPIFLIAAYTLHTAGEICLSPVGLSLVTKLAPLRLASLMMGVWFLSVFAANLVGGYLAGAIQDIGSGKYFTVFGGQADFFLMFVVTSAAAGLCLMLLAPMLTRRMHGRG